MKRLIKFWHTLTGQRRRRKFALERQRWIRRLDRMEAELTLELDSTDSYTRRMANHQLFKVRVTRASYGL